MCFLKGGFGPRDYHCKLKYFLEKVTIVYKIGEMDLKMTSCVEFKATTTKIQSVLKGLFKFMVLEVIKTKT